MGREARGGDRFGCQSPGGHLGDCWRSSGSFGKKGTGYRVRQWNDSFALIGLGDDFTQTWVVYYRRERNEKADANRT